MSLAAGKIHHALCSR